MTKSQIITLSVCLLVALSFSACGTSNPLTRRYDTQRPDFGTTALPNPGPDTPPTPHLEIINPDPVRNPPPTYNEPTITGTWTFTTPRTTTRIERKTATFSQFSLYEGQPAPTDTPFVVITVTPDTRSVTETEPSTYKVAHKRVYTLNGNLAHEYTGLTNTGIAFNELILSKVGANANKGDLCHAIALAKTEEQRKLALEILTSITWTPSNQPAP